MCRQLNDENLGGWGAILRNLAKALRRLFFSFEKKNTTNNRMEMTALLEVRAVRKIRRYTCFPEQQLPHGCFRKKWYVSGKTDGETGKAGGENQDLWKALLPYNRDDPSHDQHHVKGHVNLAIPINCMQDSHWGMEQAQFFP